MIEIPAEMPWLHDRFATAHITLEDFCHGDSLFLPEIHRPARLMFVMHKGEVLCTCLTVPQRRSSYLTAFHCTAHAGTGILSWRSKPPTIAWLKKLESALMTLVGSSAVEDADEKDTICTHVYPPGSKYRTDFPPPRQLEFRK